MRKMIDIKKGIRRIGIPYEQIIYMEKDLRKVIAYTKDETHIFYDKFCDIMPRLDERFMRPHCSYVFNMDYIVEIDAEGIMLTTGQKLYFGRQTLQKSRRMFDEYVRMCKEKALEEKRAAARKRAAEQNKTVGKQAVGK